MKTQDEDIEQLLRDLHESGIWGDEHDDILARWRERRGEAGKDGWRWWWKLPDEELYQTDHPTRQAAIDAAILEEPDHRVIELIEARTWADTIGDADDRSLFAETRNHETVSVAAND